MKIVNENFKTNPSIVHYPGGDGRKRNKRPPSPLWNELKRKCIKKQNPVEGLTIFTWNNNPEESLVEKTIKCKVLGKNIVQWEHRIKISLLLEGLKKVNTPYVMGLDAFDVVVADSLVNAIKVLNSSGHQLLFNASPISWPPIKKLQQFERKIRGKVLLPHINAGAWIGKTSFVITFFNHVASLKIKDKAEDFTEEFKNNFTADIFWRNKVAESEQKLVRYASMKYPREVGVDSSCRLFHILNDFNKHTMNLRII